MLAALDPSLLHHETDAPWRVRLLALGTAGFVVEGDGHTLVLDPFVTRPSLLRTAWGRLDTDHDLLARLVPHADDVLVGHAHHDHVLDAPALCRRTGARLIGSDAVGRVGRAGGVREEQIVVTAGNEDIASGPATVRGIPSQHGRVYFGRVTLPGTVQTPPFWPPRVWDLRHGPVLNWCVEIGGARIVHIDSADYLAGEMQAIAARGPTDVVCLCAIGRAWRPGYVKEIVDILTPRLVVPCHWDWLFRPWDAPRRMLPWVDLAGMVEEIRRAGSAPRVLDFGGTLTVR